MRQDTRSFIWHLSVYKFMIVRFWLSGTDPTGGTHLAASLSITCLEKGDTLSAANCAPAPVFYIPGHYNFTLTSAGREQRYPP